MPVTINGNGSITGLTAGGLPAVAKILPMVRSQVQNQQGGWNNQLADNSVTHAKTTGFQRRIATVTLPTNTDGYVHNVTTGVKKIEKILSEVQQ